MSLVELLTTSVDEEWRCSAVRSWSVAAPVEFPIVGSASPIGRVSRGYCSSSGRTSYLVPCPHLLFMALRDRGPPAVCGLDAPDQGVDQRPSSVVGPGWRRSILTFSPLISSYTLNFRLNFTFISFTIPSLISA
jgi:hypothetical protein